MDQDLNKLALPESTEDLFSSSNETGKTSVLPWDRFSNWIHCICIVTFDLEVGQALEVRTQVILLLVRLTCAYVYIAMKWTKLYA